MSHEKIKRYGRKYAVLFTTHEADMLVGLIGIMDLVSQLSGLIKRTQNGGDLEGLF
jgi:hypothetical protein